MCRTCKNWTRSRNCQLLQWEELLRLKRNKRPVPPPQLCWALFQSDSVHTLIFTPSRLTLNTPPHLLNLLIQHPEKFLLALRRVNAEGRRRRRERGSQRRGGEGRQWTHHENFPLHPYTTQTQQHTRARTHAHPHSSQQCEKFTTVMLWRNWNDYFYQAYNQNASKKQPTCETLVSFLSST